MKICLLGYLAVATTSSQTSAWGRISAPVSRVTGIGVRLRKGAGDLSVSTLLIKTQCLGLFLTDGEWNHGQIASWLLQPWHSSFPRPGVPSLPSAVTTSLTLPCDGASSSGFPSASPPARPRSCPATDYFGVKPHMLGQRFSGISDTCTTLICNTELLLRLASPSNFSNYSVSSSTEQLEPVPLVLNLVCYLIQLHFALISWQLFSHLRTETD